MGTKVNQEAQNPLILRCNRLIEAFAKSDDERDFFLDRREGFIIYADQDKAEEELLGLEKELQKEEDRFCLIPKLTFYETKKIMEGFVNEKVYDIDTKEKLLDIIQSKEARENFLEFIYDHHAELEKWQTYYQERSRIRIIEWLRNNHFHFVFEEDLDLPKSMIEKLKRELFQVKADKDIVNARKALSAKAKTYYSNEALNPKPKRGRPPKQIQKLEIEPQVTTDIYTTVPAAVRNFLFTPDLTGSSSTFSSKFGHHEELYSNRRLPLTSDSDLNLENLNQKLAALRSLSSKWIDTETPKKPAISVGFDDEDDDDEEDEDLGFEDEMEKPLNGKKSKPLLKEKKEVKTLPESKSNKTPASKPAAKKPATKTPLKLKSKKPVLRPIKKINTSLKKKVIEKKKAPATGIKKSTSVRKKQ